MDHYTERGDQEDRYEDDWNRKRGRMRGDYNREIWSNDWSRREYGSYGSQGQGYLGQNQGDYGNYGRGSSNEYDDFGRDRDYGGNWQTGYDREGRYSGQRGRDYGGSWMTGYDREGRYSNQGGYGRDYGGSWQTGYDREGRYGGQRGRDYGGSWMTGYDHDRGGYGYGRDYDRDYGGNWQTGYGNEGRQGWGSDYGRGSYGNAWQSGGRQQGHWNEGPHSGRGPSGYQRSDERIREDVNECLTRHGWLDASNVQVDVNNGTVTLKGTVSDRRAKRMAEDALDQVSGIKDVQNQIQVKQQIEGNRSNEGQGNESQPQQQQTRKKQATA